jgi:hypothetical protein
LVVHHVSSFEIRSSWFSFARARLRRSQAQPLPTR